MNDGPVPVVMTKTLDDFTRRQGQIIEQIATGKSYEQVARNLGVSKRYIQQKAYELAKRVPGSAPPRVKLTIFWHRLDAKGKTG